MDDLKQYLSSKEQPYQQGIELLKKHGKNKQEIAFLSDVEEPTAMHQNMLLKRLNNILRIHLQSKPKDETQKTAVEIAPLIVKKQHFSESAKEAANTSKTLEQSKELTNKLLPREWEQLDEKEKAYFKGNPEVFALKKQLLFRNSEIESQLKSLHASLPHAETDEDRQSISEQLVGLKKEQNDNWAKIDDFNLVVAPIVEHTGISEAERIKLRNNLRSRISKLEKQVAEEPEHKNFEKRKESLEQARIELEGVEKLISN